MFSMCDISNLKYLEELKINLKTKIDLKNIKCRSWKPDVGIAYRLGKQIFSIYKKLYNWILQPYTEILNFEVEKKLQKQQRGSILTIIFANICFKGIFFFVDK
jgi:hypothetical protein